MSPRFEVRSDDEFFEPGDLVTGTVEVTEGGRSRSLEVSLDYIEDTDCYGAVGITVPGGTLHRGDLEAGATFRYQVALPAGALPTYRSEHGSLGWVVHARSDELGIDSHERIRIDVVMPSSD